jgi:YVTN family beta-propeller protein
MKRSHWGWIALVAGVAAWAAAALPAGEPQAAPAYKSPMYLAFSPDGKFAYATLHTADALAVIDVAQRKVVKEIAVGRAPAGVAASPDGQTVFVANTLSHSVSIVQPVQGTVAAEVKCGYEPTGLCLAPDGKTLYTANYISDDVSVIDVAARKEVARIKVGRAPKFLAITPDGKALLVTNHLSHEPATSEAISAFISVVDTVGRKVIAQKRSTGVMLMGEGTAISADGKYAYAVHLRPNANVATTQLGQGWIQTNALTLIPLQDPNERVVTFLLDNVQSGAANPTGVAVSKDGKSLFITHRGTHQVSVLDLTKLHALVKATPPEKLDRSHAILGMLWARPGLIRRVDAGGLGPTGVAVSPADGTLWVANYFSDAIAILDPATGRIAGQAPVGPSLPMTAYRKGEFLFHDATRCLQQWLSCLSCHPGVRADGLNWDLLNDGMTNPKNTKSLAGSARTPPMMSLGVRATMELAVEKGFTVIQFHTATPEELDAVNTYLRDLPLIPSPWHKNADGSLDERAKRGQEVFRKAGCGICHPPPLYTNLQLIDVGTCGERDFPEHTRYDTPSLLELYRTAPYLHDGRAATLEEVLGKYNKNDRHGSTSKLSRQEIEDLVAFLMAL